MPLLPLLGRHALITGASGSIGAAIAHRFAAEGALVTLTGRNESALRKTLASLSPFPQARLSPISAAKQSALTADPPRHEYSILDLSRSEGSLERQHAVLDAIWARTGQIDVLVNAAGVAQWQLLQNTPMEEAQALMDANLLSAVLTSRYMARQMKRRRADRDGNTFRAATLGVNHSLRQTLACIINVASLLAHKGTPGTSVYAASKAGLLGLTHALAAELAPFKIRTNAIVPGYIQTEMIANMSKEPLEKRIPLGRLGTSEEVADAAAFLAQNPYANNCILNLDGGLSAV
ncbi:short-chain dehydrogenase [Verticillium dahliae]